jgi:hypothetical protein
MPILGVIASSRLTAAAGSYEFIAQAVPSGSTTTVTFSSIPQTYKHLELRYIGRNGRPRVADGFLNLKINNSFATYVQSMFYYGGISPNQPGEISFTPALEGTGYYMGAAGGNANATAVGSGVISIMDYTNTTKLKTARCISGSTLNSTTVGWILHSTLTNNSTSAVTSLVIETVDSAGGYNIGANSRFSLYGLKDS